MITSISLDAKAVQSVVDALPRTIFRAQRSAVSTTTTWAGKQLRDRMFLKTGLPMRVFRKFRVKVKRNRETGVVWFGLNPVKASYVGKLSQEPRGAWAGDYYFPGGFVATLKSGHEGIFKRKGKSRYPLAEQVVNIDAGFTVAEGVAQEASVQLRERFMAKVLELNPHLE